MSDLNRLSFIHSMNRLLSPLKSLHSVLFANRRSHEFIHVQSHKESLEAERLLKYNSAQRTSVNPSALKEEMNADNLNAERLQEEIHEIKF